MSLRDELTLASVEDEILFMSMKIQNSRMSISHGVISYVIEGCVDFLC